MKTFASVEALTAAVGTHLGYSDWLTVTQERIDQFAEATGDVQWIHVDPARAAEGPFGGTIAHGLLTLSLIPALVKTVFAVEGLQHGVNYGSNKVRFPSPVPAGARVRVGTELVSVTETAKGHLATQRVTVESSASDKPVCVAEMLGLLVT